ncbi:MAG: 1,4-dihydroxy-2-naphthoate polyprenyltransferase [Cyclobacteriaceae bacterium]|nr:1,4-dihydroxy-2-naphthoate polyprenyltransferase [Cyclobacteriaceae bacterium HetDA_MAG_MS6]
MSKTRTWLKAFRLRTLPLAFSCIIMGAFLAANDGAFNVGVLLLSLLTTLFLQVLSNLANDYGDAMSGVDGLDRVGPDRTVQAGLISTKEMKRAIVVFVLLSLLSGLALLFVAFGIHNYVGFVFLVLGLAAIGAALKYTIGKNPYGYAGWGDFFVFIFFGVVGVGGSYYLYTHQIRWDVLLPATSCGLMAVAVLNVNNIRDIESDRKAGKRSIPARLGKSKSEIYHITILATAIICAIGYHVLNFQSWFSLLFLLVTPLIARNIVAIMTREGMQLDPFLRQMAITTLLFTLLFGIGLLLS